MTFLERRSFTFFDLKENPDSGVIKNAIGNARVTATTHGYGHLALGDSSGNVHLVKKIKDCYDIKTFRAYELNIYLAELCKLSSYLVTIGEDERGINPVVKVWHIEKFDKNKIPVCLRISRASIPNKVVVPSCMAVTDNLSHMAVGFMDGSIILYRGDVKRERTSKQKILKDCHGSITGLAFHCPGKQAYLYVSTVNSIDMYDVTFKDKEKITNLDEAGCALRCTVFTEIGQEGNFFVARKDAVYCYTNGVKGPCYAVDGEKVQLEWFKEYLVILAKVSESSSHVSSTKSLRSANIDSEKYSHVLTVLDIENRVNVFCKPLQDPLSVLVEWGSFYILSPDNSLALVAEKDLQAKLALLFKKNLYDLAIRLAKNEQYDADGLMEIFRQYGDHLYTKGDHKGAIDQYIKTIGKLEPSYVIRKYLGSQQVEHLTTYLKALHKEGVANGSHTTLLLNFYTKLNKPQLLKEFILTKDRAVDFDVEVAIDVCRHVASEDALLLAEKHSLHDWYLTIQIEDLKNYHAALQYIAKLDFEKAEQMIKKYGITLLENIPEETTQFLKRICTDYLPSDQPLVSQSMLDGYSRQIYKSHPEDFIHYFLNNSEKLVEFLEHLIQTGSKWSPQVYTTLLEHYLQVWKSQGELKSKRLTEEKIIRLLESQDSTVDKLQALILCKAVNFKRGLLMLYNENHMHESMLKYHISHREYDEVPVCCQKSEAQRPGLWVQALWSLASHQPVPTAHLNRILDVIGKERLLPPILVMEALSDSPSVRFGDIRGYLKKVVEAEVKKKSELEDYIEKCSSEIGQMKRTIEDFKTKPVLFQASRCGICKKQLELPSVHFFCQDSFHQHCIQSFAENDECPPCLEKNKVKLEAIRSEGGGNQGLQEDFHSKLETAEDGFSLATDYLGMGVFRKFSAIPTYSEFSKRAEASSVARKSTQPVDLPRRSQITSSSYFSTSQKSDEVVSQLKRTGEGGGGSYPRESGLGGPPRRELQPPQPRLTASIQPLKSTNPFEDEEGEEEDPTNPFAGYSPEDDEADTDDYDNNLNPFSS